MALQKNQMVTGKVRLSYAHLTRPYAQNPADDPKYSVTLLIPKSDTKTKAAIDDAIEAAAQAGTSAKWNGARPPRVAAPLYDGDGVRPSDGAAFGDECRGCYVMTVSSKDQPVIVDKYRQEIIDPTEIYSGMYARVQVTFSAYNYNGKKGVGAYLGPVQKLADGEALGGSRISAEEAFSDSVEDDDI